MGGEGTRERVSSQITVTVVGILHMFFSLSHSLHLLLSLSPLQEFLSLSLLPQLVATCTLAKRALAGAWLHIEISSGIFIMKYSPCRYPHVRRKIVSMD